MNQQFENIYWTKRKEVKAFYDAGGGDLITLGTDHPSWGEYFTPFSVHRELLSLSLSGIPNAAVLRIATINSARAMGMGDRLGTIEAGKWADLGRRAGQSAAGHSSNAPAARRDQGGPGVRPGGADASRSKGTIGPTIRRGFGGVGADATARTRSGRRVDLRHIRCDRKDRRRLARKTSPNAAFASASTASMPRTPKRKCPRPSRRSM